MKVRSGADFTALVQQRNQQLRNQAMCDVPSLLELLLLNFELGDFLETFFFLSTIKS
ncbi:hypothetical protein MtrunA17_Chr7g0232851 [Medicago truncatula]|uniref:Uncharacterized protein n=1 Tax=Medicago truncatula TaxID=3880 RepID=A0A396H3R5_MEDTR|nr:hypothetical protein MtrunA17_Chr7g0232851 [Medicago truncatula]